MSGLIIAAGLPGTAYATTPTPIPSPSAASPTPSPTPTPTPTAPTPGTSTTESTAEPTHAVAATCGGELALGTPVTCDEISGKTHHTYTFRTTIADERILTQFHSTGDNTQASVQGESCFLGPYASECVIAEPGVHTIDVRLYSGSGTASYGIGVESRSRPSSCTTLDPATFTVDGPLRDGKLARGAAGHCYRFAGTAGMRLNVETEVTPATEGAAASLEGWIEDPAGERVCPIQWGGGSCSLTGDGTHTIFLADDYGGAVDYRFRLVRTDVPLGCGTLRQAGFGIPAADQVASGEVAASGFDCWTVTATAGVKRVQTTDGGQLRWEVSNAAGVVCSEWGDPCDLPEAGTYTLWLRNTDWQPREYRASIIDIAGDAGCAAPVGTGWDQPTVTAPASDGVGAVCQPFTAAPGERIVTYVSGGGFGWITDRTGQDICADQRYDDLGGCALPGTGPYRLVVLSSGDRETELQIRRLSSPAGCPVLAPGAYGAGPAGALDANRCRILDVPAAGRHLVRVVDDENYESYTAIHDVDGIKVCDAGYLCDFPKAGRYTLVVGGAYDGGGVVESEHAVVFTAPTASGCVRTGDQGYATGAVLGSFTVVGETDCLELDSTAGATIGVTLPPRVTGAARPEWTLINGDGTDLCSNGCKLAGPAPYRILLNAPEDSAAGDYRVVVQRLDRVSGCTVLPQGAIGNTVGAVTAFAADRFTTCYSIPANQHSVDETIGYAPVTGHDGWANISVRDETGKQVCGSGRWASAQLVRCDFESGKAYTVLLTAAATDFQYRISRKDTSAAGAKCQTPANTVLGGPAMAGDLRTDEDLHCYRVTAAAADSYWLGVRSTGLAARYWITDAAGADRCSGYVVPCRASGSTSYQIFVWPAVDGQTVPYRVDTWRLTSAGQPVAQCPAVNAAPAFGPISGTLSDQRTAVCVAVPVNYRSAFKAAISNTGGGTETPEPYYFQTRTDDGITACSWAEGGRGCQVSLPYDNPSGMALFVLAPETTDGNLPFRADIKCDYEPCTPGYSLGSVTPGSAPNSGPATLTLRGSGFAATDTVTLTRSGSTSIPATVKSVTDGLTMTVTADLTDATPGAWNVVARSAGGSGATLNGGLTVTAGALKATRAPSITGTVRVGGTVRAAAGSWSPAPTSWSYQWAANGVAIKGATGSAYQIPASLRGKRLTVTVIAKRANRSNTAVSSAAVTVGYGAAPKATARPKIKGTVKAGKAVKVSVGAWSPQATSYRYEWRVNGKLVAVTATLKLKAAWAGKKLTLTVVAKRTGHYDGRATSVAIKIKK
ncbi:hypothetical protein Q0Z83_091090 [Actinoplanes sichuanensis]|uniref:IPT/TIG domain-containing protein n=1 Tax=Actinoplanes sichuanensis TaxID=512349 RepID=A0ABW4AK36_9ACTN|nr:hypothetical protein [Actinoplanes sichuanensis]BEL10918.1 hypothetical protein Q0Z83_091090 [Actinoplanes sichuanensis]